MERRTSYRGKQVSTTIHTAVQAHASHRRAVFSERRLWISFAVLLSALGCGPTVQGGGQGGSGGQGGAGSGCIGSTCFCGDGVVSVEIGEECDDGDTLDGLCSPDCKEQKVLDVDLGDYFTCALLSGGIVKCWGTNDLGRLGLGHELKVGAGPNEMGGHLAAVDLGSGRTAQAISVGRTHACALLHDGAVKCWGENYYGQLGLGDDQHRGDEPNEMGDDLPPVDLGTGKTARAIAAGMHSTCALLDDASVKCWGINLYGELGLGHTESLGDQPNEMGDNLPAIDLGTGKTPAQLSHKTMHTCALFMDGSVKCWGKGPAALGLGELGNRGDEPNEMGDNLPAVDLGAGHTVQAIAAGAHTCALLGDSSVKCWGPNDYGSLGLGDQEERGDAPNEMGDNLPAVVLDVKHTAVAIAVGNLVTCALLGNGSVKCWGQNHWGSLGLGDQDHRGDGPNEMGGNLPPVNLGTGMTATAIRTYETHTCAILNDGSVKCWGYNTSGQLGLGDTNDRGKLPGEMGDALPTVKLFSDVW